MKKSKDDHGNPELAAAVERDRLADEAHARAEDEVLEVVRLHARSAVAESSLRAVAKLIGISHTALAGFVRPNEPRQPYGLGRSKLLAWGEQSGVIKRPRRGWHRLSSYMPRLEDPEAERELSQDAFDHIRRRIKALYAAGASSPVCGAVSDLLQWNDFFALRSYQRTRTDIDIKRDADRAFAFACEMLIDEGYPLHDLLRAIRRETEANASVPIERAEAEAEVLRRLPALPPPEKKKGKRRA